MAIHFQCQQCGKALAAKHEYAGKKCKCTCGAGVVVPADSIAAVSTGQMTAADDMIRFACRLCGRRIKVPPTRAGTKGKCPQCKNHITIPASSDPEPLNLARPPLETLQSKPAGILKVQCLMCNTVVKAHESQTGHLIECPQCGSFVEVPQPKGAAAATAARPAVGDAELDGKPVQTGFGKITCPSCEQKLPDGSTVCVNCGIYVASGRPILMTRGVDENELYERTHAIISPLSWLFPTGIYPVYSEVIGRHRPFTIWAVTALTILISAWFLGYEYSGSPKMRSMKNLMLWAGKGQPESQKIELFYEYTNYGDREAFIAQKETLKASLAPTFQDEGELDLAALKELGPEERCFGQFRFSQLITHAFLHGGPLHLAGNLLFLLIFGSRVCSVIGNLWTPFLYLFLAIGAGLTHLVMSGMESPTPMLGASGAVMGMAGVYLILFPIQKIFMAVWWRWGLFAGFHLSFNTFAVRGFWVVLFYIMFDVVAVSLAVKSGTAHWAHIGGLAWGMAAGIILLVSRAAYSGSDVLSLILGRHAWRLIGTPHNRG